MRRGKIVSEPPVLVLGLVRPEAGLATVLTEQADAFAIISDLDKFGWAGCEELWAALASKALQDGRMAMKSLSFKAARPSLPKRWRPCGRWGWSWSLRTQGLGSSIK
jgi:hypothetical protein